MPSEEAATMDQQLVERAKSGDATAFDALAARYQDRVYNACYRMCHNHADALDLTQLAFVRAWERLSTFESRANFFTWLFRIAINGAISWRRASRRRETVSIDGTEERRGPDPVAPPQREMEISDWRERIEQALAELDEDFRAAVVLKDIEELDYAQIAEILGLPLGTVKSRIHRGRQMLREKLSSLAREHESR